MERVNINETSRKKILKKAALLATAASITGAVTVGGQKPKESDALIGLVVSLVTTVIGFGTGIAEGIASSEQQRIAEQEAKRQAEEAARQEKMREQLETSSDHNIRVSQDSSEEQTGKEIDISIANNEELVSDQRSQGSRSNSNKTNSGKLNKPPTSPKGIQVGGFGAVDEVEVEEVIEDISEEVQDSVESNKNIESIQTQNVVTDITNQNKPPVIQTTTGETTHIDENNKVENATQNTTNKTELNKQENKNNSLKNHTNKTEISTTPKFELSFEEDAGDLNNEENIVYEDVVAHGLGIIDEFSSKDAVEFDESMVMDEETALNHRLVQEGYLTIEELILYDYGIKVGVIDENVLNTMYENGEISDESYAGAIELMYEIYEEFYGEE